MKLIYLSHWRFPSEKTMTPLILRTCAHFARLGFEVELWAPRRHNDYHAHADLFDLYQLSPRFTVRRVWALDLIRPLGPLGFILLLLSFNLSCWWRLRNEDAIVYTHDPRDVILPILRGLPTFVEIHDFYETSVVFLNRLVFGRARGLIVTNTYKIEHIAKRWGVPRERMLRQPNAVDAALYDVRETRAEARAILTLPQDKKVALYAGHLFSWKGVHTLADSAAFLPQEVEIYFIGGTEEDRAALQAYISKRRLPRIHFIAHQTPERVPLYLRAADVLVLPNTAKEKASRVETSPVKLFEYLSSGTPIVASNLPAIREIVSEHEVLFAKPDDPKSFAEKIVEALSESVVRPEAGKRLAALHSWEARAQKIRYFMNTLL